MSLIDEALKKAELEAARRDGLKGGAYPWVPEHMPRRRRRWMAALFAALIAMAAAGGVWWLSRRQAGVSALRVGNQAEAVASSSPAQSPKSRTEMETVEVAPPPVGLPSRVQAREKEAATAEVLKKTAEVLKESGSLQPPREPARARNAPPAPQPRPANAPAQDKSSRGLADGKTYVGQVTLPDGGKIELGGIVFSESHPVALINDKVLGPGAVVDEFTIVSIQPDRVEMKGRGITIYLRP